MPAAMQTALFDPAAAMPEGFAYRDDFVDAAEERALLETFRALPIAPARYRDYVARRRTASFGYGYDFTHGALQAAPPLPGFLAPLRDRAASWIGVPAESFVQALVTEYRPGTPIGWHRDVPQFEHVVGISLVGACRMRFRPYPPTTDWTRHALVLTLAPRSAYQLRGDIRWKWQHAIPEVRDERWSVTFRTLSTKGRADVDRARFA
jgi:alkylated DNA repair dioxygenase AlkB